MIKRVGLSILALTTLLLGMVSMVSCSKTLSGDTVLATLDDEKILYRDIEDDINFVAGIKELDLSDEETYQELVLEVLNTYMIDLMCQKELESLGLDYNKKYYSDVLLSLFDTYGSEAALVNMLKQYGLDRTYAETVCKRQARQATLYEHVVSEITVEESQLMEYYFTHVDDFHEDEVRDLYTIYYSSKEDCQMAIKNIQASDYLSFYEKVDVDEQGNVGEGETSIYKIFFEKVTRSELDNDSAEDIFALENASYNTEPIKCSIGYCIVYVSGIHQDYTFTYDEMKPYIEEAIADDMAEEVVAKFFEELNNKYAVAILYPDA